MQTMRLVIAMGMVAVMAAGAAAQERPGNGVTMPSVVREVKPQYTAEARKARVQGRVVMEVVVKEDGAIGEVRVTQSLGYGLDEQAIKAVKQWEFKPGTKGGKAVPVLVEIEMTFTLK